MLQNSRYFSVKEFTHSDTAVKRGINNLPNAEHLEQNIQKSAEKLDKIREFLGFPLIVSSWFRCDELNKAVGGSASSDHRNGFAIDVTSRKQDAFALAASIVEACEKLGITYDQVIFEQTWVHISFAPRNRLQKLTYRQGVYRQGFQR